MGAKEQDVIEVPGIGKTLHGFMMRYYDFRQQTVQLEAELISKIGTLWKPALPGALQIHLRYYAMRFSGSTPEAI